MSQVGKKTMSLVSNKLAHVSKCLLLLIYPIGNFVLNNLLYIHTWIFIAHIYYFGAVLVVKSSSWAY